MKGHRKHSKQGLFPLEVPGVVACLMGLLFLLSSCWHPPFDPWVSAALISSQKLGSPLMELRTCLPYDTQGGYYLPSRDDINQGFWINVNQGQGRIRLTKVTFDLGSQRGFLEWSTEYPADNPDGLQLLPDKMDPNVLFVSLTSVQGWIRIAVGGFFTPYNAPEGSFLGAGFTLGKAEDAIHVAALDETFGKIKITSYSLLNPQMNDTYYNLPTELPVRPIVAIMRSDGQACLSGYLSDGTAVTYYWAAPEPSDVPPVRLPMNRPVTGLLSDGRLMADTGARLYLYDEQGNMLGSIATGDLHFSYEWYNSALNQWMSRFTRTILIGPCPSEKGFWQYLISVYEIPTKDLSRLQL